MRKFLLNNWIVLTIGTALIASMVMAIRNKAIIDKNSALQEQSQKIKGLTEKILTGTLHGLDLGARGYALTKEEKMLEPYQKAIEENTVNLKELEALLTQQKYYKIDDLQMIKAELESYIAFATQLIEIVNQDTTLTKVIELLREDRGNALWKKYNSFAEPLMAFEDGIFKEAQADYNAAVIGNLILQVCIVLLVLPALFVFVVRIRKEREARNSLLLEVEQNDRKFVFDPGTERSTNARVVIGSSITNVRTASDFIKAMATGN